MHYSDTKLRLAAVLREPIVKRLAEDEEVNFLGVLFVGSPQANEEKFLRFKTRWEQP